MTDLARHGRYPYSAIPDRPDFTWPDGKRIAIYIGLNLEWFAFGDGPGARLDGEKPQPDVQNYAWRDYGNRVGVWRLLRLFDRLKLPVTALPNVCLYDEAPEIMAAIRARGDEVAGHGVTNSEKPGQLDEAAERQVIETTRDRIAAEEGAPPKGWLAPWISESAVTPDLLAEAGYTYVLDWCHDDQPVWITTRGGPLLSVPYPQELNDIPQIVGRGHEGYAFAAMIEETYRTLRRDPWPVVMGIALHPYLVGQPHRFGPLSRTLEKLRQAEDVWFTTAGAIAEHYAGCFPPPGTTDAPRT